jgi:4-amino-4-deoxy-L-arabinose transferase-like glycosyltransferase
MPDTLTPTPRTSRSEVALRRVDLLVLGVAAVLLRLPALLATRHLTFDDGVYGASAVAMREGGVPFRDVFSSQGPVFLPLVWVADLVGLHTLNGPRLVGVVSGVVLTLVVYLVGLEVSDRTGALLAAGLTTTAGSILWVTGPIASDGPALAAATFALLCTLRFRTRPSVRLAVGIGLGVGMALSIKLTTLPVVIPVGWVLVTTILRPHDPEDRRGPVDLGALGQAALAGATAVLIWLLPAMAFGLTDVWDQSVTYHSDVSGGRDLGANISKVASTFADRDLVLLLFAVLTIACVLLGRRGPVRSPDPSSGGGRWATSPPALLWAWLAGTVLMLLYIHPLWRPHVSGLVAPIALLIACYRPQTRIVVIASLLLAPVGIWRVANYLVPGGYTEDTQALLAAFDDLPDGAWVISDEPGHVWRDGRRTTDDLVDTSYLRIESGRMTSTSVSEQAADPRVCAVVVWSSTRFGSFDDLGDRLAAVGYGDPVPFDGTRVLYTKDDCTA